MTFEELHCWKSCPQKKKPCKKPKKNNALSFPQMSNGTLFIMAVMAAIIYHVVRMKITQNSHETKFTFTINRRSGVVTFFRPD